MSFEMTFEGAKANRW